MQNSVHKFTIHNQFRGVYSKPWMHLLFCLLCVVNEDTSDGSSTNSQKLQLPMKTATVDTSAHDFKNPLYAEPVKDSVIEVENGNQMQSPSKLLLDLIN